METLLLFAAMAVSEFDLRKCSVIEDSVKRLECFDELTKPAQRKADAIAAQAVKPVGGTGKWRVDIRKSPMDDSAMVVSSLTAEASFKAKFSEHMPILMVRCMENKTSLILDFDGAFMSDIQGFGEVTFRTDKDKAVTRSLEASTDNNALGLWSGGAAIPAIKSLFGKTDLLIRFIPHSESPQTVSFKIENSEAATDPVRKACGW